MFDLLDKTIEALLDDAMPIFSGIRFGNADISFKTPEKGFAPKQGDLAINLFLYEVKENRELRWPEPIQDQTNSGVQRRAPLRVDCAYMVSAWSNISTGDNVSNSHKLLGEAFNWLSRFPVIPEKYVITGGLTGQLYDPPTMVAQMDGAKSAGEFWHALGIPPRPYFNLIVTICMDLDQRIEDPIVTTLNSQYRPTGSVGLADGWAMIGGTVRDSSGRPVPDAWVRLESGVPAQHQVQISDVNGCFIFERVAPGAGYSLRARASGIAHEAKRNPLEVPSITGSYDLQFS